MNKQSMMMGMLIKKYRVEQNMSQEGLCQGICAVSYLSKIEKGSVSCSEEILHQLMDVLGIDLCRDPGEIKELEDGIANFYRSYFLYDGESMDRYMTRLDESAEQLQHSSLAVDYMLVQGFYAHSKGYFGSGNVDELRRKVYGLLDFEHYMNTNQTHLTHYLIGHFEMSYQNDHQGALSQFERAARIKRDGIILEALSSVHYNLGNYPESIRLGDRAYQQLMEEGYLERAIGLCFTIAAAYANMRDIENMHIYYQRLLTLGKQTTNSRQAPVYYNIGSTYLAVRNYDEARSYLEKSYSYYDDEGKLSSEKFYLVQKLALVAYGQGDLEGARKYTEELQDIFDGIKNLRIEPSMKSCLDWLENLCIKKESLESPSTLEILRKLYKESKKDSHHGFQTFYGDYFIDALKAQHRYKEALQITEEIFVKWKLSSKSK